MKAQRTCRHFSDAKKLSLFDDGQGLIDMPIDYSGVLYSLWTKPECGNIVG
jgi:hypothetical protein